MLTVFGLNLNLDFDFLVSICMSKICWSGDRSTRLATALEIGFASVLVDNDDVDRPLIDFVIGWIDREGEFIPLESGCFVDELSICCLQLYGEPFGIG